jgi:hypothetical protein
MAGTNHSPVEAQARPGARLVKHAIATLALAVSATVLISSVSAVGATDQSSGDGVYIGDVFVPNNCPPPPVPAGPLAGPGLTDTPYNHRAFEGETDSEMLERHKRESMAETAAPCERDFENRMAAAEKLREQAIARVAASRGHEYVRKVGEAYSYDSSAMPVGILILSQDKVRVIFIQAFVFPDGTYENQGDYFNCTIDGTNCDVLTPVGQTTLAPPPGGMLDRVVRDARAGRLRTFSNGQKFMTETPW